jgi:putative nucleotidyltransferase with HDIG domain
MPEAKDNPPEAVAPYHELAARRLRTLVDISRSLAEEVNLPALLALTARRTSEALDVERTSVWLHDADRRELWTVVAEGELREIRMPDDAGIAGAVATAAEPAIVQDVSADPRWNKNVDKRTGYVTRNMLCVPMEDSRAGLVGVFQCLNKARRAFDEEDLRFLQAIAAQAAIYIQNARLFEARKRMFDSLVDALAESIESRDPLTAGHSRNVMRYAVEIAEEMGLTPAEVEVIRYAALLHDYGKIGVPDLILRKPSNLTGEEFEVIKKHVNYTEQILARIHFEERLRAVPQVAAEHHERIDGSGYPRGLAREAISLGGRVIAVADAFDAMTSRRHYRNPMTVPVAMGILTEGAGTQFDRAAVTALETILLKEGRLEAGAFD